MISEPSQTIVRASLVALLLAGVVAPARADQSANVQSRIDAALKTAKSFAVTTRYPAAAYSATLVHVAPDRSRVVVAIAASTTDVVRIGSATYSSKNGAPFVKVVPSADASARPVVSGSVKVGALDPDVTVAGVTYGAFETTLPFGTAATLKCTYDKRSFRLVQCAGDDVTQTYSGYDDPSNVVEPPENVDEAPLAGAH
jgi:hypothetical protein